MPNNNAHRYLRAASEGACGIAAVAVITLACFLLHLHEAVPTCLYLLAIVLLSLLGNFYVSAVVSFVAVGCLDYFFVPPIFSFTVTDPADIVAIIAFLGVSGAVTQLVSRVRLLMEEKLRQSDRRYAITLSSIGDAVIAGDDRARVTFMNPVAEKLTRWTSADAIGKPITEVFHIINEETRQVVEDPAAKVLRLGTVVGLANHTSLIARDGRELPIDDCGSPIVGPDGKVTGVVLVFRDMTQRRKADEAEMLRRSKERLELAVHGSNLSIWEFDMPDGRIENSHATLINVWELLGYDPATAPTDFASVLSLEVHPDDLERLTNSVNEFLAGDYQEFEAEYRVRHKGGMERWRLTRGVAVRNAEGKPVQFIGSCVDITDLKRAEEGLRKSEQRFRTFVDHATDAFFLHDENLAILDMSRKACESLGYTREELLGITPLDFDLDVSADDLIQIKRKLAGGQTLSFESRHRRKNGTIFPVEIRGQALWEGGRCYTVALARDITDRKQAEAAIKDSEARFRGTFENAAVGIAHCDLRGRYLRVNQKYCDILGYSREELLCKTFQEFTLGEDLDGSLNKFTPLVQGDISSYSEEKRLVRKDGARVWVNVSVSLQLDAQGKGIHSIGILQDISQRKRLEEELRESEHRWRSLTEALPQLVWSATPDGSCDYFSTQWTQHTGVVESELLGWRWMETLHPDDRAPTRRLWTDSVAGRGPYDVEYRVRRADGVYRWFKTRGTPIRDSEGKIFKWFGTCTDITDARQADAEHQRLSNQLRLLLETTDQGIYGIDQEGRCTFINRAAAAMLGYSGEEVLGRGMHRLIHHSREDGSHYPDSECPIYRVLREGGACRLTREVLWRKDGTSFPAEYSSSTIVHEGRPQGAVVTITDVTERRHAELELRKAKEIAESANRAKDEFLANVSHEIRTPMNAILGMTELALDSQLTDSQRQILTTVKSAADNLLSILNDLLDFSKIEAGKLELNATDFSLRTSVGDTVRTMAIRADRKGLELICDVHPDVPDALFGDAGRLRQILLNLIGNAIKFTEKGEVVVQVNVLSNVPDQDVELQFTIRDTGIGIPSEKHAAIFRAFEQEDSSTTRKYGGTGLGLTISTKLAEMMGGRITVESEIGRGSTFRVTARLGRGSKRNGSSAGASPDPLMNLRVLVVDDNATNRQILKEWLHSWRMRPDAVGDAASAVAAVTTAVESNEPYELVLLDGRMPDTDGLALAEQIRQRAGRSPTRFIILSSDARPVSGARYRGMGISAHLLKPAQQSELLETIRQVMTPPAEDSVSGAAVESPARLTAAPHAPAVPLRILIAEDNEFNVALLQELFAQKGHRVEIVGDGREALARATTGQFDLLLLDIHMPEMDGFQVVKSIRDHERAGAQRLPIIAFTARSRKQDRDLCLAAGMDDFLSKPVKADELWAAIDRVAAAVGAKPPPAGGLLDADVILRTCGGDAGILQRICRTFQASVPNQLARVRTALEARDARGLREAAHLLRGTLSAFSTGAGAAAANVEDQAARDQIDACAPLVLRLESVCSGLIEQTRDLSVEKLGA
jgi:PAS domain S-box-containing protein